MLYEYKGKCKFLLSVNVVLTILSVVQYCYISFYYSANSVTEAIALTLRITGK